MPVPPGRAAVIFNPVNTNVVELRSAVAAEAKAAGWLPSVWFETTVNDPGHAAAKAALEHSPTVVIVVGGDGTIRAVAQEIWASGVPLAIIAAGTGNLLARTLGLMTDVHTSVRTAFTGTVRPIDVGFAELEFEDGRVSKHVFLVMTGVGLDARMAADTNVKLKKRIGWLAYTDPIGRSVLGNEQFSIRYRVDDARERSVRAHTVIVGNCGTLTAGILLLPDAEVDDGLLDVVLMRPKGFWQWLRVGTRLGLGGILNRTKVGRGIRRAAPRVRAMQYVQARKLRAWFDEPQRIQLDGDSFGRVTAAAITVRHHGLHIRVPDV